MPALAVFKRIYIRDQVSANAKCVDVLLNSGVLTRLIGKVPVEVADPDNRGVGDAHIGEDLIVEAALAQQQLLYYLEELSASSTLNYPVVIGRGEGENLSNSLLSELIFAHALELGRVLQSPNTND